MTSKIEIHLKNYYISFNTDWRFFFATKVHYSALRRVDNKMSSRCHSMTANWYFFELPNNLTSTICQYPTKILAFLSNHNYP